MTDSIKLTIKNPESNIIGRVKYPAIESVSMGSGRPIWSVMIPTYNGTQYLEKTLRSVLDHASELDQMQIEVIDDCSTRDDPETLVKEIGQGRISFFRNPQNVGLVDNWNTCIQRSRGHWVHILHQDDIVMPGFYEHLKNAIDSAELPGAAFCRHVFMDEDDCWQLLSPVEQKSSGIIPNWIERIATAQRIQFPSIVVKRTVYEKIGGFYPEVHYAADWEMWQRISAYFPMWYEPRILACYREHTQSETSRLLRSGSDTIDTRKAIEVAKFYLPSENAKKLSQQAKEHYAMCALVKARRLLEKNDFMAALIQIREAFRCSLSYQVSRSSLPLLKLIAMQWILQQLHKS